MWMMNKVLRSCSIVCTAATFATCLTFSLAYFIFCSFQQRFRCSEVHLSLVPLVLLHSSLQIIKCPSLSTLDPLTFWMWVLNGSDTLQHHNCYKLGYQPRHPDSYPLPTVTTWIVVMLQLYPEMIKYCLGKVKS